MNLTGSVTSVVHDMSVCTQLSITTLSNIDSDTDSITNMLEWGIYFHLFTGTASFVCFEFVSRI